VAVREVEAWLLSDRANLVRFLSVPVSHVSRTPELLDNPKSAMVELARRSRRRDIREDMVPRLYSFSRFLCRGSYPEPDLKNRCGSGPHPVRCASTPLPAGWVATSWERQAGWCGRGGRRVATSWERQAGWAERSEAG
jgi:hypothetical protein